MLSNLNFIRKIQPVLISIIVLAFLSVGFTGMAQQVELNVGTASMGGAYYPMGQALGNVISKYVEGVSAVPVVTGGAAENPRLISYGDVDFAITNGDLAYFAHRGEQNYDQEYEFSAMIPLHPSLLHIITLADSSINSFSDIVGKRAGVGTAGGGSISFINALIEEYGITMNDFTPSFLAYADQFTQLSDRNLDICFMLAGYPASAATQIAATHDIKFIHLEEDHMANLLEKYPYYTRIVVPKEVYGLDKDAVAIGVSNVFIVRNDLDEELVYNATKAIVEHLDEVAEAYSTASQIDLSKAEELVIPFHPGAERYLKEAGILK